MQGQFLRKNGELYDAVKTKVSKKPLPQENDTKLHSDSAKRGQNMAGQFLKNNGDLHDPLKNLEQKRHSETFENDRKNIYQKRRETMLQACAGKEDYFLGNYTDRQVKSRILIDLTQKLAYCTIEKTASTFWKRIFRVGIFMSFVSVFVCLFVFICCLSIHLYKKICK